MKDQTFGIEIEFLGITRAKAAQAIADHFGTRVAFVGGTYGTREVSDPTGRRWKVVSDNSIDTIPSEKCELVSPICRWEDIELVQALVRKLRAPVPSPTTPQVSTSTLGGARTPPRRSEIW